MRRMATSASLRSSSAKLGRSTRLATNNSATPSTRNTAATRAMTFQRIFIAEFIGRDGRTMRSERRPGAPRAGYMCGVATGVTFARCANACCGAVAAAKCSGGFFRERGNTVAAAVLGGIQRRVGVLEYAFETRGAVRLRDADRDGDAAEGFLAIERAQSPLHELGADLFGQRHR